MSFQLFQEALLKISVFIQYISKQLLVKKIRQIKRERIWQIKRERI